MTAELKGIHAKTFQDLDVIKDVLKLDEEKIAELEKENVELKEKIEVLECDNYNANCNLNLITDQLTKAKEFIKDYMIIAKGDHCTVCSVPEENRCINVLKLNEQAEQFLKE